MIFQITYPGLRETGAGSVFTRWSLDDEERAALANLLPRAGAVSQVSIRRGYDKARFVVLEGLSDLVFDASEIKSRIRKIVPAVKAAADKVAESSKAALDKAADDFESAIAPTADHIKWAEGAVKELKSLRKALATADATLTDKQDQLVSELEYQVHTIANEKAGLDKARQWVLENMPRFIYVDEYPELPGRQNIAEHLSRRGQLTTADRNFEKLCKVAGLDPEKLHTLLSTNDHETRNQLANRSGSVVTQEIRRLWRDRSLKVRFHVDANSVETLISDPNATYDVEVPLSERSRGFQWFFSFYVIFAADTKAGSADKAVLLLDEPGLYLHARSQGDLLQHFEQDFKNQIVYTTHSPFMVPTHRLESVRTVSITEPGGTTVTNDPTGDSRTLFPLQAALGYNITQGLFLGSNNLIVEGVTDFWMLTAVSAWLAEQGRTALDQRLTITPVGGAQKVGYMVALLTAEEQNVLVLLDQEKEALATRDELVKHKLIADSSVVFVSEAFSPRAAEADVEDLLDTDLYENLVRESYADELKTRRLVLNQNVPRIAKRMELAFDELGVKFNKTRPARLLLKKMTTDPGLISAASASRFEALFKLLNTRLAKQLLRARKPFEN